MQYISYIASANEKQVAFWPEIRNGWNSTHSRWNTQMKTAGNMKMKLARVENGLSQQELADKVEATRQTIGLIESGNYNPTLNLCIRIARALGKTLNDLFWEDSADV